jgi:phosphoglycolate phosphatase
MLRGGILMIKLCIFDLDGTLIDSLDDLAYCANKVLSDYNFPTHPVAAYQHFVGDGLNVLLRRALGSERYSEELYQEIVKDFQSLYHLHYLDATKPYKEISNLLEALTHANIKTAIFTNKPHEYAIKIVSHLFPQHDFVFVQGQSEAFPKKPDAKAIKFYLEKLHIAAEDCIYIGDSDVDIYTGHHAKMPAVGVAWGFRGEKELWRAGADAVIQKPLDLLNLPFFKVCTK